MFDGGVVSQAQGVIASIVSLWRYPVKSMMGEELDSSYVTERGLLGDRAYALVDQETGKVASAKNPRKWGSSSTFELHLPSSQVRKSNRFPPSE